MKWPNAFVFLASVVITTIVVGADIATTNLPPIGTSSGRGAYAVDLQLSSSVPGREASGSFSALIGGSNNVAAGMGSFVGGSSLSRAYGRESWVGGTGCISSNSQVSGANNFTFAVDSFNFGDRSVILGGKDNWINAKDGGFPSNDFESAPMLFDTSFLIGSYLCEIQRSRKCPDNIGSAAFNGVIGGFSDYILDSENSHVFGSRDSAITNSVGSIVLGGFANRVADTTNAIVIGSEIESAPPDTVTIGFGENATRIDSEGTFTANALEVKGHGAPDVRFTWAVNDVKAGDVILVHAVKATAHGFALVLTNFPGRKLNPFVR